MIPERKTCLRRLAIVGLALMAVSAWCGEPLARYDEGKITLRASETTLHAVFESLTTKMPLTVRSGQSLNHRVSIDVADERVELVFRKLLRRQSYTLIWQSESNEFFLWVFADDTSGRKHLIIGGNAETPNPDDADAAAWNDAVAAFLDSDPDKRIDAMFTLSDVDAAAASGILRAGLDDPNQLVRIAAIDLLGDLGEASILKDSWWILPSSEKIHVIDALGDIETSQSTSFLSVVAGSANTELAEAAEQYLEERR